MPNAPGGRDICHIGVVRNGHARWLWAEKLDAKAISVDFSGTHQHSTDNDPLRHGSSTYPFDGTAQAFRKLSTP